MTIHAEEAFFYLAVDEVAHTNSPDEYVDAAALFFLVTEK
jgi:hypothetical protein